MIVCGIDYSLTSPALTVHVGSSWSIKNCRFYYLSKRGKYSVNTSMFYGTEYPDYVSDEHRYDNLKSWVMSNLQTYGCIDHVFIEGYAFGAVGRVFQIAENTGCLKHQLWIESIPHTVYPPTSIKKFATGKGNAKKDQLYEAFITETSVDIRRELGIINVNQWNPLSDIVDSYYIAKMGFEEILYASDP